MGAGLPADIRRAQSGPVACSGDSSPLQKVGSWVISIFYNCEPVMAPSTSSCNPGNLTRNSLITVQLWMLA